MDAARGGSIVNFTRPLAFDTLESAGSWLQAQNPRLSTSSGEELEQMVKCRMKENWAGRWVFRHDPELYWIIDDAPGWSGEDSAQVWERLASISCPTLLLRGEESVLLSADTAGQITAAIPDATLVEIPGAGHSIHSEAPDLFREAVVGFLGENG
jgi:pimeloyl-ACP methyl ester carboxylesterase